MSILSIESLKNGGFVGAPVEREVEWEQNGEQVKATVFVRPMSYQTAREDILSARDKKDSLAGRIASSIVDAEGKPIFTIEDITGEASPDRGPLNVSLTTALLVLISEVNGLGKESPASLTKNESGTN